MAGWYALGAILSIFAIVIWAWMAIDDGEWWTGVGLTVSVACLVWNVYSLMEAL